MIRHSLALAAALGTVSWALPAAAADAPKPLRTMTFDVTYSAATLRREQTSGFTNGGGSVMGSGVVDRRFTSDDRGTLTVAVIAAPGAGGLVVDAAFAGKSSSQPVVRVAILDNGQLSYNPNTPLAPECLRLLPFLSRGFIKEKDVSPGGTWNSAAAPPASGTTTYRVKSVNNERATIGIESAVSVHGPAGFDETEQGTTTYATDVLVPLSLDLTAHTRRLVSSEQSDTTDLHLVATLTSDSFAKR